MIRPTYEEIKAYLEKGYRSVPVGRAIEIDKTPIEVLKILENVSAHCYLLESAASHGSWGRYTFLGYDPVMEISCSGGHMKAGNLQLDVDDPTPFIGQIIEENKSPRIEELPPFTGGLVGYFAYDYMKYVEKSLTLDAQDSEGFRDVDLMIFDKVIAFDKEAGQVFLIVNVHDDGDTQVAYNKALLQIEQIEHLLRSGQPKADTPGRLTGEVKALFDKAQYCRMVEKAKHHIVEGDIFQIVLSNRLEAPFAGTLLETYERLRQINPSPYMFYFTSPDMEVAGASPETLVKLEKGVLHTFPLAGTRPRGKTPEEDIALEKELLADEKELAEHSMLVDLGRNDLGKISKFGTVEVEESFKVQRYSHVMHIGSSVRGQIKDECNALDAVRSVLPAGTLSGAPKIRACQLINDLEDNKRGIYGGAIGYVSFTGDMDTCIGIRLAYKKNGKVFVRSGAGIVADSVPEKEYQECINKAKAVMQSLGSGEVTA